MPPFEEPWLFSHALTPNELLEKGRLLDQVGHYDDAWAAFAEEAREITTSDLLNAAKNVVPLVKTAPEKIDALLGTLR